MTARGVGAVVAGFLFIVVSSTAADAVFHAIGLFPPVPQRMSDGLFVFATAYRTIFTVLGGWITARLAPREPTRHALALSALGLVGGGLGVAVAVSLPELGPLWYPVALLVEAVPCVLLGAWLALRTSPAAR